MKEIDLVVQRFVSQSRLILGENLVGVYLHGSAVMGCFNPAKSDLDFIVEYACWKAGIELLKANNDKELSQDLFILYSEQYGGLNKTVESRCLRTIVMRGGG